MFEGRLSRLAYWRRVLVANLVAAAVWTAGNFAIMGVGPVGYLVMAGFIPLIVWSIALAVRRLHDRDKGAAWLLVFGVGPVGLIGLAQAFATTSGLPFVLLSLVVSLAGLFVLGWGWVEIGFRRGSAGINRFGPGDEVSLQNKTWDP